MSSRKVEASPLNSSFFLKKNERKLKKVLDRLLNLCYNEFVIKGAGAPKERKK